MYVDTEVCFVGFLQTYKTNDPTWYFVISSFCPDILTWKVVQKRLDCQFTSRALRNGTHYDFTWLLANLSNFINKNLSKCEGCLL